MIVASFRRRCGQVSAKTYPDQPSSPPGTVRRPKSAKRPAHQSRQCQVHHRNHQPVGRWRWQVARGKFVVARGPLRTFPVVATARPSGILPLRAGKFSLRSARRTGVWGAARAVPGLAALLGGKPSGAQFSGVSCPSAGDCGAAGSYSPRASLTRAFVISEKNGTWGKPTRVTGLAALAASHFASVDSVACPSAGNCSAGGSYAPGSRNHSAGREAFLVGEKHGFWGKAQKIAGLAKLNNGGGGPDAGFSQISCS